jgi:hypothetical protein
MQYLKGLLILAIMGITGAKAIAQETPTLDPKLTEVWAPKPPVVTPGAGTAPPSDAIVLFDGNDLNAWLGDNGKVPGWKVADGAMTVTPGTGTLHSKQKFGDVQLHLEWRAPAVVKGEGQGRGNSGVFLMGLYEVQVLDSYQNETYVNGQAGSLYKQSPPMVNASLPPGEWQTYDIIFMAPEFTEKGMLKAPARVTVIHNGVLIQHNFELRGPTEYDRIPMYKSHGKGPLQLQDHGDLVSYRNIWVREL